MTTKSREQTFDADDGSVEITGDHPVNPHEKPVVVPTDGDDGQPVIAEDTFVEKEPITIISDAEAERQKAEQEDKRGTRKDPADGDEEEAENEEDDAVTKELKHQRNLARRAANKERKRKAIQYKDSVIRDLQREVQELKANQSTSAQLSKLDADQAQIQNFRTDAATRLMLAEKKVSEAFKNGDAEMHTTALKEWNQANSALERADGALRVIEQKKKEPVQQQEPVHDRFVQDMAADFQKKNPWFDPKLGDRDSRRAKRISEDLIREDYDPGSDEYWDELSERLEEEIPHRTGKKQEQEEDDDDEAPVKPKIQKKLPVSSGGGREVRTQSADGKVAVSDITSMQRSILRQMGFADGSKEWMEMAMEYKKKNRAAQAN